MRFLSTTLMGLSLFMTACAGSMDKRTLSSLEHTDPDLNDVQVGVALDQALVGYRKFLAEAPESSLTPEAMRRLADLQLEKKYGHLGAAQGKPMPAPESATDPIATLATNNEATDAAKPLRPANAESDAAFEERAASEVDIASTNPRFALPGSQDATGTGTPSGPLEAIALYDRILATYPGYPHNDEVLYQKARAYDELGRTDEAVAVIEQLIGTYPQSRVYDEAQFRRAEYFFTRRRYLDAEEAYQAVASMGPASRFYELALYKLGWTFYKQELYEEALDTYVALLDYKVATGYDFQASHDENDERRIADTFRVVSLSFSILGGAETIQAYFSSHGTRTYEDKIYSQLGEFYLEKLRYADAAGAYETFVTLHPFHRSAPRFSMRVVDIYEQGGFGKLVLEAKKSFAQRYALQSEYWEHFPIEESPDILDYLKGNLEDLASHYHAMYQQSENPEEKHTNYTEALQWYAAYLASFPDAPEAPEINYRLADLHLEEKDFVSAAREYERTAYDYPSHERASKAGYAAIYAYRQNEGIASEDAKAEATSMAVTSSLRFVDVFPDNEHAAVVLGAAVDDLYTMKDLDRALANGETLIARYPDAEPAIVRQAWIIVAHSLFDLAEYPRAEDAYGQALAMTAEDDDSRSALVDNLAASIYKQGEQARLAEDYRAAADHFLRVAKVAPTSMVRPAAEYDAGMALIQLEDWANAAAVLEAFRKNFPDHELNKEATRQIASVYRSAGDTARSAEEYERVAAESDDAQLRRDALLTAGQLYEEAKLSSRALAVYQGYVRDFPEPLELAIESRFKIAELHESLGDTDSQLAQLREIVAIDRNAGDERTDRVRYLAARSALQLAEVNYEGFCAIEIVQPFQSNLQKKQASMNDAIDAFGQLVDYEVGEVTAAATFYIAQTYFEFGRALLDSERPEGLSETEMQEYETVLEEKAYPFEERAIAVHEKNLELMRGGVYNAWIEKSLGRLAETMPGRYAKFEESIGLIDSLERYAYQPPTTVKTTDDAPVVGDVAESVKTSADAESETPAQEPEDGPAQTIVVN